MKTILDTFKKSVYDPVFYQNVSSASLGDVLRHYTKFILILSGVLTFALCVLLIPQGIVFVKKFAPDLVKTYYPKELSIHIEKGIAVANVAMPYFVPISKVVGTTTPIAMQNMLVIDTTGDFDKKKFEEYKTYTLLTSTDIVTKNDDGQITIQSLRAFPTTTISQEVLLSWVTNVQNNLGYIVAFGIIGTFILTIFGYFMYLIPLLIFAFIPMFVAYLKKTKLSYAAAYKMSLYAIIPALTLKTFLNIMGVFFLPAYFTLLVFMLIIAVNMREVEEPTLFENN